METSTIEVGNYKLTFSHYAGMVACVAVYTGPTFDNETTTTITTYQAGDSQGVSIIHHGGDNMIVTSFDLDEPLYTVRDVIAMFTNRYTPMNERIA